MAPNSPCSRSRQNQQTYIYISSRLSQTHSTSTTKPQTFNPRNKPLPTNNITSQTASQNPKTPQSTLMDAKILRMNTNTEKYPTVPVRIVKRNDMTRDQPKYRTADGKLSIAEVKMVGGDLAKNSDERKSNFALTYLDLTYRVWRRSKRCCT